MNVRICVWILACLIIASAGAVTAAKENPWVEIRSPHFTVYSDAGEKKARRITHEFEKFHTVIRKFIPSINDRSGIQTIVLAARDERTLRSLLPQFYEKSNQAHPSGIFVGGAEKNYVALRLDMDDDNRYHVIYHEYVHLLMRLNYPPLPVWLSEGLAECFGYTVISDDSSKVGTPSPQHLYTLRNEPRLSLGELFAVTNDSSHYRDESKVPVFYAQSWALTHMLLLGEQRAHAHKLLKYLELIHGRVPIEEATAQAFGDLDELERQLDTYIRHLAFYTFEVSTPTVRNSKEYSVRTLSALESRSLHGDFFVSMQLWPEAKAMLDSVLAIDPKNAAALTSMGIFYAKQNNIQVATRFFQAAADSGSTSHIAHYHIGTIALKAGDYKRAESSFRKAIELNPSFALAYAQLAGVLALNDRTAESALDLAVKAVEMEPGVLSHRLVLANALMHLKRVDLAIQYAEQVEAAAVSTRDREEAGRFLTVARRYRDNLEEQRKREEGAGQPQQSGGREESGAGSVTDQDPIRRKQLDAEMKAIENAERDELHLFQAKADAYEKRERIKNTYLEAVRRYEPAGTASMEGVIRSVRCFDPAAIEITLEAESTTRRMHIKNYFEIRFMAMDHNPEGELKPCTDLLGHSVTIDYIATPGEAYDGEIQSIGIYKKSQAEEISPITD